jgi:alkylation response protein AidB-like acyl-CoA dehydrogenase
VHFALNEEQALLKGAIERFTAQRYDSTQSSTNRENPSGYCPENWRALADLGLLALPFSAEDGGLGGGAVEIITAMEVLGRALAIEPILEEIIVGAGLLARAGTPEQKEAWLPRIMSGSAHVALAHFEHAARFNLTGVRTVAHRRPGGAAQLHGEKAFVPLGEAADAFIVSAREAADGDAPGDIRFYFVSADAPGVERKGFRLADGSAASRLVLHGAPGERLSGGFAELAETIDVGRIAAGAEMLGIMSTLLDATLEYVRTRKQFGTALGSFQVIQHRLVDLYVSLELSRSQLYRAALSNGGDFPVAVAGMKSFISSAALTLGEQCIHMHGAMGTTEELSIGRGHKRLMVLATLFGDADFELGRFIRLMA